MITVSLCMIVKDEEEVLDRCLSGMKDLVDEMIIVDTGSKDRTKEIAGRYTDKVFTFEWTDDFSAARNFSFSKASMEYCMWMDADDVLLEKDRMAFLTMKRDLSLDTDIVMMRYHTAFDEKGNAVFWYYRERLIRNGRGFLWQGAVHEVITPGGNIVYSEAAVSHKKIGAGDPDRNLNIYKKMLAQGKVLNARELYYYARELYYHGAYGEAAEAFGSFLRQPDAWLENKIEACQVMAQCYEKEGNRAASLQALLRSLEHHFHLVVLSSYHQRGISFSQKSACTGKFCHTDAFLIQTFYHESFIFLVHDRKNHFHNEAPPNAVLLSAPVRSYHRPQAPVGV
jgi:hypothetical protein